MKNFLTFTGREFHNFGAAYTKLWLPYFTDLDFGKTKETVSVDRKFLTGL